MKHTAKTLFIALIAAMFLLLGTHTASAQEADTYGETPGQVLDDSDTNDDGGESTEVLGSQTAGDSDVQVAGRSLALTGGDVVGLTVIGGALLLTGTFLVMRSRRQHQHS